MAMKDLVELEPSHLRCPYATYDDFRSRGVHFAPEVDAFVVSAYEDVVRVLRDHQTFSSTIALGRPPRPPDAEGPNNLPLLLLEDQPTHTEHRAIVNRGFTPARLAAWEPEILALVDDLIAGFRDRAEVEFISAFSGPLPIAVITTVLGVPQDEAPMFRRYSEELTASLGGHDQGGRSVVEVATEFGSRILPLIKAARGVESEHILPVIAEAEADGRLSEEEATRFVMELIVAGNITTAHHLTSSMLQLATDPSLAARLRADPGQLPGFIEDSLRLETPIQGFYRLALEDAEIGGEHIPEGSRVFVLFGAANRDPDEWSDRDQLLIDRERATRHAAFGKGIHTCLGAPLARLESRVAFERLLAELPPFELACDEDDIPWLESFVNHGPVKLPLKLLHTASATNP